MLTRNMREQLAEFPGFSTFASDQAGKFTRPLSRGPNLISTPLIQLNESIKNVLQTVKFDKVWSYDSLSGKWNWHMRFKTHRGELKTINHTMGIWVNVTAESNLTVAGIVPAQIAIHLHAGWNLVGFPSFSSTYRVANLKASTNATRIEGFDPVSSPYHLKILSDTGVLRAGEGYWINVPFETQWVVRN